MSTSLLLVPDLTFSRPFDREKILNAVRGLEGAMNCKEGDEITVADDLLLDCRFSTTEDATNVSIPRDLLSVSIDGVGDAALNAAIGIQRRYGQATYVVLAHSPDVHAELSIINDVGELREKLDV